MSIFDKFFIQPYHSASHLTCSSSGSGSGGGSTSTIVPNRRSSGCHKAAAVVELMMSIRSNNIEGHSFTLQTASKYQQGCC